MKLDPKKSYLVTRGELMDDGTVNVCQKDGQIVVKASRVVELLKDEPSPDAGILRVFQLVGTFTPDCKWEERA